MSRLLFFLSIVAMLGLMLLMSSCGHQDQLIATYGADVSCEADYAKEKAVAYFGKFHSLYTIAAEPMDQVAKFCGGAACSYGPHIVIHYPDTREYICQQILHELGHIILKEKTGDYDYNHTNTDFFGNADQNIRGYVSYACEPMRTESVCGEN